MAEEKINVEVGKYTLESLTTGMYSEPKIIYREYIQNSVDSLEQALAAGIIDENSMRIEITVEKDYGCIRVSDNGTGINVANAPKTLLNIGNSSKRQSTNRGFRGIGRLGGMSYCDKLIFITSAEGEDKKTTITFDCSKLREMLVPGSYDQYNLQEVLDEITDIKVEDEKIKRHYFTVDMEGVSSFSDLLDIDKVKEYVSQVAPVAYEDRHFMFASHIEQEILNKGYKIEEFPIYLGDSEDTLTAVFKPYHTRFKLRGENKDEMTSVKFFDVDVDGESVAYGWYGVCDWKGTLSNSQISGLRFRKGNILIGDDRTATKIFKSNQRFNGWTQGEIFVVSDKLIPNARRDDFEQNETYLKFIDNLSSTIGPEIAKEIRIASTRRNDTNLKKIKEINAHIDEAEKEMESGFNSNVDKNKTIETLKESLSGLADMKPKDDQQSEMKKELIERLQVAQQQVADCDNYKLNTKNFNRKIKKTLNIVADVLSERLTKETVSEILDEINERLDSEKD